MADDDFAGLGLGPKTPRMPQEGDEAEEISVDIDPAQLQVVLEELRSHQLRKSLGC